MKPTGFMSNASKLLAKLTRRCGQPHSSQCTRTAGGSHVRCEGRVASDAAVYPDGLCRAMLQGMIDQMKHDGRMTEGCFGLLPEFEDVELMIAQSEIPSAYCSGRYRDDLTGQPLVDDLVAEARKKELQYFCAKGVWIKRPKAEARTVTGKSAISVRWVDVNKGDDQSPRYRSRRVARQIKALDKSGDCYFAPAPPLESLRTILSLATTTIGDHVPDLDPKSPDRTQSSTLDITRAYFNAVKDGEDVTYVELPPEDQDHQHMCAKLLRHMYGTRSAADGWQECYSTALLGMGSQQGWASPCTLQ